MWSYTLQLIYCAATALLGLYCLLRLLVLKAREILSARRKRSFLLRLQALLDQHSQLSQAELGYQVAWLCRRLGRVSWLQAFHEAMGQLPEQSESGRWQPRFLHCWRRATAMPLSMPEPATPVCSPNTGSFPFTPVTG